MFFILCVLDIYGATTYCAMSSPLTAVTCYVLCSRHLWCNNILHVPSPLAVVTFFDVLCSGHLLYNNLLHDVLTHCGYNIFDVLCCWHLWCNNLLHYVLAHNSCNIFFLRVYGVTAHCIMPSPLAVVTFSKTLFTEVNTQTYRQNVEWFYTFMSA